MMLKPKPIQLPVFWCQECQALLCGQDSLNKHNEMCYRGHQDDQSKSSEGQAGTYCSGKTEEKKKDGNESVSRGINDGLPVRSEQSNETLDGNCRIRTGLKATLESEPSCGQVSARREDGPLNEKAGTSQSFVMGISTQGVLPNNLEIANKGDGTSSSRTDPPQVTAIVELVVEGILPGVTANPTELVEKNHYDCELCDQPFRQLQLLIGHLVSEHKVGPVQVSAIVMKFAAYNDEDMDLGVRPVNVDHHLDYVAGERNERIGHKPSADDSNEVGRKSRSRSPSVEILGRYQPPRADGINQGSTTSQIDSTLEKTGSPNVEAANVEVRVINDQGRSSGVRSSNRMQPPADGIVGCKWCTKSFYRNCHLTGHIRRRHPDQKIVQCTQCKLRTAESLMGEHISNRHGNKQDQRTSASTSRAILTPQPQALPTRRRISLSHRTEKLYPCDQCQMTFRRPSQLGDHKANAHSNASPYTCRFCGHQDTRRYKMNAHMKNFHRIVGVLPTRAANVSL